ncbi:E motif [Dillenia turbinata]|uniref:E motif n=1 Tax=Dillenia turbinata TaxID=194707 RepID=A0AAN8VXW4_9MAGN
MISLLPTNLLQIPLNPSKSIPALKSKQRNNSLNFSSELLNSRNPSSKSTRFSIVSCVFPCEENFLYNEWPQILQTSIGCGDFLLGQSIHAFLVKFGYQNDTFRGNNLVNLYAKLNRLGEAQRVFDEMLDRNKITWTSLMNGYLQVNDVESVFQVASQMCRVGERFNEYCCSVMLQACSSAEYVFLGKQIHCFVVKSGFREDIFVATSLISMYSMGGCSDDTVKVFAGISVNEKDVRCMNLMISEYGKAGSGEKAIWLFLDLLSSGLDPDDYTFTNIISVCKENTLLEVGRQLQGLAMKYGFVSETSVRNAIITMYGKHGLVEDMEKMFQAISEKNLVSWTALLSGYVRNNYAIKALSYFVEMLNSSIYVDSSCLSTVLDGCSECKNLDFGLQIHGSVIKIGYLSDVNVGTALIHLYAKCSNLQSARLILNGLSHKTAACFNAILVGFTEIDSHHKEDALFLFSQQREEDVYPDAVTFSQLLSLSANQASLIRGKSIHACAIKMGCGNDISVANAAITMYAKCGSIDDAYLMFRSMNEHDTISWNAMVSAYALHGQGRRAFLIFEEMQRQGFAPDKITILSALQGCCYSGLWEDGICLFNEMEPKYGVRAILEHFACMVDLLGRAGRIPEALNLIKNSPYSESPLIWRTLVNVCKLCGDLSFGKIASKHLLDLTPEEAGSYILISNFYAGRGMLKEAAKVRTMMNDLKLPKEAGYSTIEVDNKVHLFVASSKDHPETKEIYAKLDLIGAEMGGEDAENVFLALI